GSLRPLRRRRGAITLDDAKAELEEASERDGIFDLLFDFARQYFDYTAVFVVHGEIAEGRDAFGDGAPRDRVARIGVPLDMPSILATARAKKTPLQRVPAADGLDAILMSDLGRPGRTVCAVLPVIVRTRVVAILLGDGGETGLDQKTLADVEGIVALASNAFERVIVRRKLKGSLPPGQTESMLPGGGSLTPPKRGNEISNRPSVEELAAPIRELMNEPMSLSGDTLRQPQPDVLDPSTEGGDARAGSSQQPPPLNLLAGRRPSGAPIPREEPSTSAAPRSRRRGEAPRLDFQAVPSVAPMFASEAFAGDEVERQLLAEIHGRAEPPPPASEPPPSPLATEEPEPATPRDPPRELAIEPPPSTQVLSAADSDVVLVDADSAETPVAPMVDMDGLTPIHPPVSAAPLTAPSASPLVSLPGAITAVSRRNAPGGPRLMPPSEQVISVPAHRPPSSRNQNQAPLPSVIVDVSSEYIDLVDRVISGRIGAEEAENALLRAGGHAMPAIMARFPGPITLEQERLFHGPLPRVSEGGPVIRLVASQRRTAFPFVMAHVADTDAEKRFWATYLLMELPYPDTLEAILSRVFDEQPRIRRVARAAARAFAEAHPGTIVERLDLVASDAGEARERRVIAVETLGETREVSAVPSLIPLLDDHDAEVASAARSSLVVITRQDFGGTPQKWSLWWAHNHDRHRVEWLIDALMHDQGAIRAAAGEELKNTTKEYFGYYDDLPKRERERAQSRYREWWQNIGRVRFSRSSSSRT
ncbi:MAG: hypothetical protein JWP97_2756, partial [Labilithrix sp.]|nr:hypothetical protein [Labilithrix sp.]